MEKISYEKAAQRLQDIIQLIESDELKVDQLTSHLKEAKELVEICKKKLRSIEEEL